MSYECDLCDGEDYIEFEDTREFFNHLFLVHGMRYEE